MNRDEEPLPSSDHTPLLYKFLSGQIDEEDVDSNGKLYDRNPHQKGTPAKENTGLIDAYLQELRRMDDESFEATLFKQSITFSRQCASIDTYETLKSQICNLEERMRIVEHENTIIRRVLSSFGLRVPTNVYDICDPNS